MSDTTLETTSEFVCDLSVFTPEQREHHIAVSQELFGSALEVRELPNGYAARLPDAPDTLAKVASFIADDRKCCAFINFGVEVEPHGGPIWLRLTGAAGIKQALGPDLSSMLNEAVASAVGLR